jgi:uncharacterized protein (TIGR02452 family)
MMTSHFFFFFFFFFAKKIFEFDRRLKVEAERHCVRPPWAPVRGLFQENTDQVVPNLLSVLPLPETSEITPPEPNFENREKANGFERTRVACANVDTLSACLSVQGPVVALSFANAETPGGRYRTDGRAQEEDLCRCLPLLFPSLTASRSVYPLVPGRALLTRRVAMAREPGSYRQIDPAKIQVFVDVVTAAMPCGQADHRPAGGWLGRESRASGGWAFDVRRRIRAALWACEQSNCPDVVLGAWGCGAFGNPAAPVAALFKEVLTQEFTGVFRTVLFAVFDPLGTGNLKPFANEFNKN